MNTKASSHVSLGMLVMSLSMGAQSQPVLARAVASPTPIVCTLLSGDSTSRFHFVSSPWVNLHNFLVQDGKRVRGLDNDGLSARGYLATQTPRTFHSFYTSAVLS